MPGPTLSISLDYGEVLSVRTEAVIARVAEIMTRPCFSETLRRVSARRGDRLRHHPDAGRETITSILRDQTNDSVSFDNGRRGELTASAEIESGTRVIGKGGTATGFTCYVAIPYVPSALEETMVSVCDLAAALDASAGFVALEPEHGLAHRVALGGAWPKPRIGLSDRRRRERRARHWYAERLDSQVANIEWVTLLGRAHLAQVSAGDLRASGAFTQVIERTSGSLVALQVTSDPMDDLSVTNVLEDRLVEARAALASVSMDISAVNLDRAD